MSQNKKLSFHEYSKQELEELKRAALTEKQELEELKKASGEDWEVSSQKELDALDARLVAINEAIASHTEETSKAYVPTKGTEKMVHLSLVRGRRFNPNTGKEESKVFTQYFTYSEWLLFKAHYRRLGYTVVSVLHDPYGEAEKIVTK